MKEPRFRLFTAIGLALAGLALIPSLRADTTVLFAGGNASQNVLYDRVTNILTGGITSVIITPTNSTVRTYVGTINGQPGLGNVTIHFSLLGAVTGLQDLSAQNDETTATTNSLPPTVAVSSSSPEAVGVDSSPFVGNQTLVIPYAYIKAPNATDLAGITNLTQRQVYYLEGTAGTVPISYYGGTNTNYLYFVARNTASAVRTETDANVYFTGTPATYITNASGQPILDAKGGQSSGANVRAEVAAIGDAIGTVAASDISTFTTIPYEGVPYSITNVENGSYPLWFYESWFYEGAGQQGAPSAAQLYVINALYSAVTDTNFQATDTQVFVNKFAPLNGMQVSRSTDGGPITSLNY
jgi:hypothetical protein